MMGKDSCGIDIIKWFCVAGYVVQGSNGEYAYMRAEEKIDLVHKVRELAPKGKLILAGSGCEGNRDRKQNLTIRLKAVNPKLSLWEKNMFTLTFWHPIRKPVQIGNFANEEPLSVRTVTKTGKVVSKFLHLQFVLPVIKSHFRQFWEVSDRVTPLCYKQAPLLKFLYCAFVLDK